MIWSRLATTASFGISSFVGAESGLANCSTSQPSFHLTLTPSFAAGNYSLHGNIVLDGRFAQDETVVMLPETIASVPSAQYGPSGLVASDDKGALSLGFKRVPAGGFGLPTQGWIAERATEGPISINFSARPVSVNTSALLGPHFDIRNATGGLSGSMWALVPVPDPLSRHEYNITLSWNIGPDQGAAITWADGVGPHSTSFSGPVTRLIQTFFIVGDVKGYPSMPAGPEGKFGMYWLEDPTFDIKQVGEYLQELLAYSTKFWQDNSTDPYRVFVRINEEQRVSTVGLGAGGTALTRSFMFGYNPAGNISMDRITTLLAHEMTHNWTPWNLGTNAEQSRYNEGAAEFWSLRLLWRAGRLTTEAYLREMNERAAGYYTNKAINMTDEEAQAVVWEMRDAQRIPYGRGMLHFANVDAQIRARSNGTQKLDDVAIAFLQTCHQKGRCGADEWFPLLRSALGEEAVDEWKQVSSGHPLIKPQEGSLGPCFDVVQNGTSPVVYIWKAKGVTDISSPRCLV